MVISAILLALGVSLVAVVAFLTVFIRRRWLTHHPGAFQGSIRVTSGDVSGLGENWRHGFGRWGDRELLWVKTPFLFRKKAIPINGPSNERAGDAAHLKRLGGQPVVLEFTTDGAVIEIAAKGEDRALVDRTVGGRA